MQSEPEYVYVKGSGWIPRPVNGRWKVIFHKGDFNWQNANHTGSTYTKYEHAEDRYKAGLARPLAYPGSYYGWEWKLVTAEEFPEQHEDV